MMRKGIGDKSFRPELIKRIVIYSLLVILVSVAQCSFFSALDICPAMPDLVIGAVIAVAMIDSAGAAMIVGICAGFLTDSLAKSASCSFSALFYLLVALLLGTLAQKMLPRFMSWVCLMIPALLMRAVYTALCAFISVRALPSVSMLQTLILPELIATAILSLPIYPIVKLCNIPMNSHGKFSF